MCQVLLHTVSYVGQGGTFILVLQTQIEVPSKYFTILFLIGMGAGLGLKREKKKKGKRDDSLHKSEASCARNGRVVVCCLYAS